MAGYTPGMPSQILHILHGRAVCAALGPGYLFEDENYPYFCLGCQGPDIFYHNQRTRPSALEYGSLLHRRNYGDFSASLFFEALSTHTPSEDHAKGMSFATGFILHAFLDRALHPYIISRTGVSNSKREGTASGVIVSTARLHMFLERILDSAMLRRLEDRPVSTWPQKSLLADPATQGSSTLKQFISKALKSVFPERAVKDRYLDERISNTFVDASYFYAMTSPEGVFAKSGILERLSRLGRDKGLAATAYFHPDTMVDGVDYCNFNHSAWLNPCEPGQSRTESVEDLFHAAVHDSCRALEPFWRQGELVADTGLANAIGNGNLSLAGVDGKRCQPLNFSTLGLGEALEREYETRRTQGF